MLKKWKPSHSFNYGDADNSLWPKDTTKVKLIVNNQESGVSCFNVTKLPWAMIPPAITESESFRF
jgi:hypothetical protein